MTRRTDPRTTRSIVPRGELPDFTPVPRKCHRHDGWTVERQHAFIEALADTGSVNAACKAVDMTTVGAYYLRRQPGAESFRKAWQTAIDLGVQKIEDVAMDRALNGVEVPVYSYGQLVGKRTVVNDRLLMFMLRNRAPERFAEGKPKALNAIGKMDQKRLKKKWRAEWEAQQRAAQEKLDSKDDDAILEDIAAKLKAQHTHWLAAMSPRTRAAWDAFKACEAEDEAAGYQWQHDPEHPFNIEGNAGENAGDANSEEDDETLSLPPPGWSKWQPPEPEEHDSVRRLKDDRW
ncbi:hypothetical protein [Alteripontixanthobacter maritimus]|nr:hypothetical protein [Alteripontixanthobacter maritimus]